MTKPSSHRPRICLCMIVRDEAHIIHELVAAVAPHIDHWVIVDTGSSDGTQEIIRRLFRERGIPGELHERAWKNFGDNRTEALALAQGRGDYIWVMDADDTVEGTVDFRGLTADGYSLRLNDGTTYWRHQLFRDGLPWRYVGVLHEVAMCDVPHTEARLEGDYCIRSRRLGARNRDPLKYARDAEILQAEVNRNADNKRSVFYLAQSYAWAGDFARARQWFERRVGMGGWDEEVFYSLYRLAEVMEAAGEPWPFVEAAYLRAWARRPTRVEPLYAIACHHRVHKDYALGHLFAERAAQIPLPTDDLLFVTHEVYEWRALDEQAVCGSWIGRYAETFAICQKLLARTDLPEEDRRRIAANRDLAAQNMSAEDTPTHEAVAPNVAAVGQQPAHLPQQAGGPAPMGALAGLTTVAHEPFRGPMVRRLLRRAVVSGQIRLPAVPALLDDYQALCERSFAALGIAFNDDQRAHLRGVLAGQLGSAYAAAPRAEIVIAYESPVGLTVKYTVTARVASLGETYERWVAERQPPYFGTTADARVTALAAESPVPAACPVLDIGAGTGRNALALARRGHPVDAMEMTPAFTNILRVEAARESLPVRVIERDVFASRDDLHHEYGLIVLSEVVPDFRTQADLRRMFEIAAECLTPGGRLVFNVFLPQVGYEPSAAARELGLQVYAAIFTYPEVASAVAGLPLVLVADDAVHDYEKQYLPEGAWPPTDWYADWVSGLDVFDVPRRESPIEMRWLVYRKVAVADVLSRPA